MADSNTLKMLVLRLFAPAVFGFMLVMKVLATSLPLNGWTTGYISDRYDNLFAPIGLTLAIWGATYLHLGVYRIIGAIAPWVASSVPDGAWIVAWHYEVLWLDAAIILGLLETLIRINQHTTANRTALSSTLAIREFSAV